MKIKKWTACALIVIYVICSLALPILNYSDYNPSTTDTDIDFDVNATEGSCVVFFTLPENCMLDVYQDSGSLLSYSQYLLTEKGKEERKQLFQKVDQLSGVISVLGGTVRNTYVDLILGVSASVDMVDLPTIQQATGTQVYASMTFAEPQVAQQEISLDEVLQSSADAYQQYPDHDNGVFTNDTAYTGEGILVAVLDSGFNLNHDCFNVLSDTSDVKLTATQLRTLWDERVLDSSQDRDSRNFAFNVVYKNNKIPYFYDYADNDFDVTSTSSHGMHVASIIGGNDEETVTGAAPDCQLALMKVFDNNSENSNFEHVVSALSDCAVLGVDVANMSLGSIGGMSMEYIQNANFINQCMLKVYEAGVILCSAAGNDYYSGYRSLLGDTSSQNVDNGLISSPASYLSNFAVASANAYTSPFVVVDGNCAMVDFFVDENGNDYNFDSVLFSDATAISVSFDYIYVGEGLEEDYLNIDVKGKFVIVDRGTGSYYKKHNFARSNGACGMILVNTSNVLSSLTLRTTQINSPEEEPIPSFVVTKTSGDLFDKTKKGGQIVFSKDYYAYSMSDFSAWGPNADLSIKPEITAFGGNVLAASINSNDISDNSYMEYKSGTSMATPNATAICAVAKQYLKTLDTYKDTSDKELALIVKNVLANTALPVYYPDGTIASVRKQGAGLVSINTSTQATETLVSTYTGQAKIELGDDPSKAGKYNLNTTFTSFTNLTKEYTISVKVSTARITLDNQIMTTYSHDLQYSCVVTVDGQETNTFTTIPNESCKIKVKITLSDQAKEYLDRYPYGCYVEGFLILTDTNGNTLSVPWLAFYGDWDDVPIVDVSSLTEEKATNPDVGYFMLFDENNKVLGKNLEGRTSVTEPSKIALSFGVEDSPRTSIKYLDLPITRSFKQLRIFVSDSQGNLIKESLTSGVSFVKSNSKTRYQRINFSLVYKDISGLSAGDTIYLTISTEREYVKTTPANGVTFGIYLDGVAPEIDAQNSKLYCQDEKYYLALSVKEDFELMYFLIQTSTKTAKIATSFTNRNEEGQIVIDVSSYVESLDTQLTVFAYDYALNVSQPIVLTGGEA